MTINKRKQVSIYTDGSCLGNPGPGGYGAVLDYQGHQKELSQGFRLTTNNRMELLGAIKSLYALKESCIVILYSDSQYITQAMQKGWPKKWKNSCWRRGRNKPALNSDLWEQLLNLCEKHCVQFRWIRGHSGHPENERCDKLAVAAASSSDLEIDAGYERVRGLTGETTVE